MCMVSCLSVLAIGKKECVIRKSEGSITFVVDENISAPTEKMRGCMGKPTLMLLSELGKKLSAPTAAFEGDRQQGPKKSVNGFWTSSFDDAKSLNVLSSHNFFDMMLKAYATHRPVVLSPDDVWLLISQGFAYHVNKNAESLRDRLVSHDGKMELTVITDQPLLGDKDIMLPSEIKPVDWPAIFDDFARQMRDNSKDGIVDLLKADFSTTTVESGIASQITLMNAMQPYFSYRVMRMACGIPYVTLKGTTDDWLRILHRTQALAKYDLEWWTARLCPVLEEFVKASQGKPNQQFWRCIVKNIAPDKLRKGGCGNEVPTKFDGWFLNFFPYDERGRTPSEVTAGHRMLNDVLCTDFVYMVCDGAGHEVKSTPMQFYAGFVGVDEAPETYELRPRIGWLVRENLEKEYRDEREDSDVIGIKPEMVGIFGGMDKTK